MSSDADGIKDRVRKAISSGNRPTRTVLSSLLAAHDELGYLPDEAIEEVAVLSNTTINEVWGVASFYTNFRFTRPGAMSSRSAGAPPATWREPPTSSTQSSATLGYPARVRPKMGRSA